MTLSILSPDFPPNGPIPSVYTCEGEDAAPTIGWSGVPAGTESLALIVDDPDAPDPAKPQRVYVHWVLYDIPPSTTGLPRGVASGALPPGTREGKNDWDRTGYGGPCPPIGRHRYFFHLYALDTTLGKRGELTRAELDAAMKGHIIEEAVVMGTYEKEKSG